MLVQRLYRATNCSRILQRAISYKSIHSSHKFQGEYGAYASRKLLLTASSFTGIGALAFMKKENEVSKREVLLTTADTLFDQGEYEGVYKLLSEHKDSKDVEILWRLSRALYNMSKLLTGVEAHKLILEAYDLMCTTCDIQEDHHAVHKWLAILLDSKSTFEGIKVHLSQLYNIKKHMLRASELKPTDATTLYMLGCWCYEISSLTWYQRKLATIIYGQPPTSSYEEALVYYEKAEIVEPNFYSYNLLMLGKTYLKLDRKDDAIKYLKQAAEFRAQTDDDQKAKREALKLLSSI